MECSLCLSFSFESSNFKIQLLFPVQSLSPCSWLIKKTKRILHLLVSCLWLGPFITEKPFLFSDSLRIESIVFPTAPNKHCKSRWLLMCMTLLWDVLKRLLQQMFSHLSTLIDLIPARFLVRRLDLFVSSLGWTSGGRPRDVGTARQVLIGYSVLCMAFERHAGMRPGMYD